MFVTAANIVVPFIIGRATDTAVSAATGTTSSSAAITTVLWLAGAFFLVDVLSTITSSIGGYYGDVMSQKMRAILSVRYYEKLLTLPHSYFDFRADGHDHLTPKPLDCGSHQLREVLRQQLLHHAHDRGGRPHYLAIYSPWLALLLAIVFPVYLWLTALTSKRWQRLEGQKNEQIDLAGGRFTEVVGQIRVVKSFRPGAARTDNLRPPLRQHGGGYPRSIPALALDGFHRRAFMSLIFFGIYAIIFVIRRAVTSAWAIWCCSFS